MKPAKVIVLGNCKALAILLLGATVGDMFALFLLESACSSLYDFNKLCIHKQEIMEQRVALRHVHVSALLASSLVLVADTPVDVELVFLAFSSANG